MFKKMKAICVGKAFDAIESGNPKLLQFYLKHCGVHPDSEAWRSNYRPYPLPAIGEFHDEKGLFSLLNFAIRKEQFGCMKILLERGAGVCPSDLNIKSSPLHVLFEWYHEFAPIRSSQHYEKLVSDMVSLLLSYTDVNKFMAFNKSEEIAEYHCTGSADCTCGTPMLTFCSQVERFPLNPLLLGRGVNADSFQQLVTAGFPTKCSLLYHRSLQEK